VEVGRTYIARAGKKRNAYRILEGKPEGKRTLGRPKCRWLGNNKMDLRVIEWDGMNWIDVAQGRDQWGGSREHGAEPSGSIKCWEVLE
jgi:hypothetical protein